ncbi:hypothetical protein K8O68_13595 [Salipaludibacillus sp. CUR1]|uniref:hypothetical protein n=1 Tax=Salipaludibacillus sp. CUR1 TaxID=2820003 RepID=UPI001E35D84B|nr:hypothetical protein [Salipaludibacillus sp. CUR1]MCE7793454.1 hypothetical protein [Salipaludibacillus sp. CUR1]
MAKLKSSDYQSLKQHYHKKLFVHGVSIEKVLYYIGQDVEDEKQAQTMTREIVKEFDKAYNKKIQDCLKDCIEVLEQPEKWAIDRNHNIKVIYPHPVIKDRKVIGTEYKDSKYFSFTDHELFKTYVSGFSKSERIKL